MKEKQHFNRFFMLGIITAIALSILPISSKAAADTSPKALLEQAWELVQLSGSYHFSSRVVQTTHPAPSIANAGRTSRVETVYLDGNADLPAEALSMRLWQGSGNVNNPDDALEIRVEGQQAFGRVSTSDWQELDNFSGGFAPGNDFSAFLMAARNIKRLVEQAMPNVERLAFDVNGPVLAEQIRAQMEDYLRKEGELPAGIRLSTPEEFRDAIGTGEVWIDGDGLPLRLSIYMQYPQRHNGERVEAQIFTDFADFNREAIAQAEMPVARLQSSVSRLAADLQKPETLISVSFVGLLMLAFSNRRSKKVYTAIVVVMIFSMVVTPLLESAQAYAFTKKQIAAEAAYKDELEQQQATQEMEAELYGSTWNPHQQPLAGNSEPLPVEVTPSFPIRNSQFASHNSQPLAASGGSSSSTDSDDDGLVDDDDPCPDNADCDGDGLTDLQEERLGTDAEDKDTDGDQISDQAEVIGFWYNNQWWYSNPTNPDTNNDGQFDTLECLDKTANTAEGEVSPNEEVVCQDSDEDGTPDLFDRDDDGDGVPDNIDLSPYELEDNAGDFFDQNHPLLLQVDGLQSGEPAFVDFQLRPQNDEHLWYALNVLDWPSSDQRGQVQRKNGNNSTFEDINDPAPNASNGDMRLIPMLEIELTGQDIPLKFTNPEVAVEFSGAITTTIHFEQNGDDIKLDFSLDNIATYTATINADSCHDLGEDLITFVGVTDTDQRTIPNENLIDLADGFHGLILETAGNEYCMDIDNVTNGPFDDRIVDRAPLDPYGITVREKNNDGTLLAYVPLNLVADETGNDRVAFTGRMQYRPGSDQWGDTQKVNVVWVVQMLTDHTCTSAEDYAGQCTEDEWVLDSLQVVRAYPETWYLTGLSVREDHGVDISIIYEDPSKESEENRQYDDLLWGLAWGFDKTFLVGRDEDGDGNRDITMFEIYARWGDPATTASDEMRWDIPITRTQVVTYAYEIQDQYIQVAMSETEKILDEAFLPYIEEGADAPTLLFTQEARYRNTNLSSDGTTAETISDTVKLTFQIDPDQSQEETLATMSWAPYRYQDGEWQSYPIEEYWDRVSVRFEDVFTEFEDDARYDDIRRGQVFLAQMFYLSMYRGASAVVQTGEEPVGYHETGQFDADLQEWMSDIDLAGGMMGRLTKAFAGQFSKLVQRISVEGDIRELLAEMGRYRSSIQDQIIKERNSVTKEHFKVGRMAFITFSMIALYMVAAKYGLNWLTYTLKAIDAGQMLYGIWGMVKKIYEKGWSWFRSSAASSPMTKFTAIGLLIGSLITWGMFAYNIFSSGIKPGSMAGNFALAQQIASTIAAVILLAIAAIPVVGTILATVISLFDFVVLTVCGAINSENPVCRGISGWIAYGVRWVIYSGNIMVDLEDDDRLTIYEFSQDFLDAALGMSIGNSLVMEATIRNEISLIDWGDTDNSVLAGLYWWQYNNDNLRSSTFRYNLESSANDHHEGLSRNGIPHSQWTPTTDGGAFYIYYSDESTQVPLAEVGINQTIPLYLNESFAVPAQECWLFPNPLVIFTGVPVIPVCYIRTEKGSNNINLGENMHFDVFPSTLDEFYALTAREGGYALGWSEGSSPSFPRLQDVDGDGLRAKVAGGSDPNDLLWDTDGDGLSDYFEVEINADPEDVDTDDDGLWDYDEVLHDTDLNLVDSDFDGLTDKEELDGWEFIYDFDENGAALSTWVTSDPLTIDGDNDSISDFQEKTYGFHPGVVSDPNILTLASQVNELDNPTLLLRLDEVDDATAFSDDSGFLNNGTCSGDHCPAAGHLGQYGNAPHFDGSDDYIEVAHADTLTPDEEITLMAWVYLANPTSDQKIVGKTNVGNGYILGVRNGHLYPEIWNSQGTHYSAEWGPTGGGSIPANTWTHLAITWKTGGNLIGYINGTQVGNISAGSYPIKANTIPLTIGIAPWDATSWPAEGRIDEVLFFPRSLSAAEIQEQAAGRYNPADLQVKTGNSLYYEATVKNELLGRYAEGLLSTNFPAAFNELPPQDFVLNPQESATLSGTVTVGAAASGVYTLTQEADALITDWREDSDYAELLYRFSDTDTFLDDESGSQPPRDGECPTANCPTLAAGRYGNGASFDGSNDYIEADEVCGTLTTPALSFGAWFHPLSGGADYASLFSFNTSNGGNRNMLRYNKTTHHFCYYDDSTSHVCSANTFAPGQWYHAIVTIYEGDSNNGYLYVNGNQEAKFSTAVRPATNGRFSLGQEWDGGAISDFFLGYMDEAVVYPRALTFQEVQDLYNNPVFHLPFDEGSGATTFADDSGFHNDAVCSGAGCPVSGVEGISLNSAQFDGTDDYLTIPDSPMLDLSDSDFTLAGWFYPEGNPPYSDCPFRTEYFTNQRFIANENTVRTCENYPINHNWADGRWSSGQNQQSYYYYNYFSVRWTGEFFFREGDHTFTFQTDDGMRAWFDDQQILNEWRVQSLSTYNVNVNVSAGWHTVKVEYFEETGSALAKVSWSPGPLPHPQGLIGADDYPAIQRVGNRLRLVLNPDTEFLTADEVLTLNEWNHVAAVSDGATWFLYVNGVEVDQFNINGETPEAGSGFDIGRANSTAQLDLQKISVIDIGDTNQGGDGNGEFRIQLRRDGGGWQQVWSNDTVWADDYNLNLGPYTFSNQAEIKIYESDANEYSNCGFSHNCGGEDHADEQMGTHLIETNALSPNYATERFESSRSDVADLLFYAHIDSIPFDGKIDEVNLYKSAFSADQVENLYLAGTQVMHLPLDDAPGASEFEDIVGQHNVACSGIACPTAGVAGRQEMALLFDGANDYAQIDDADVAEINQLTLATWVRFDGLPTGADDIMRFITVGNEKAVIRYDDNASGDLHFYIKAANGSFYSLRYGTAYLTDHWYHVAGTYDGSTMRLYLDGVEVANQSVSTQLIGGDMVRLSHPTETLDGYLDEVRIYRRALTVAQIQQLVDDVPEMLLLLDEAQGQTSFSDATDKGHTGTCTGNHCPQAGAKGQIGLAALFDGSNDFIEIPDAAGLNPDTEMTLSAWVKLDNDELQQKIVGKTNGTPNRGYLIGVTDGQLHAEIWDNNGTIYSAKWGRVTAGYWTHLTITWETGGDLVGYINGNEVGRIAAATTRPIGSSANPLRIGIAPWNASSSPATGRIDHVTLYNRTLSPSEVRAMFRLQAKWVEDRQNTEITIDNDAPSSVLITNEEYRPNQDVILIVAAEDATTFVTQVEMGVSTDGGSIYTWTSAPACQDTSGGAAWCPTFEPSVGEGRYKLMFRAVDNVGNQESPTTVYDLYIDDTPPDATSNIIDDQILDPDEQPGHSWLVALSGTINDPDISGTTQAGSGASRLMVKLTDTDPVTDTLPMLQAEISGSNWSIDYPLQEADPTGSYIISVQSLDQMGNDSGWFDLVTFGVDAAPPVASLDDITAMTGVTGTITTTLELTGPITETGPISAGIAGLRVAILPAAMQSFSGTVAIFHFDEPVGSTKFANVTGLGDATCAEATCPTVIESGQWGNALWIGQDYNYADEYLSADEITAAFSETNELSFGAWVNPDYNPNNRAILAFNTADGDLRNQIVQTADGAYRIRYMDGEVTVDISYLWDTWAFVMVTIDADGNGVAYLNGEQKATFTTSVRPDPNGRFSIGQEWDGDTPSQFYDGLIDEVYIFNRALAPNEVYGLFADAVPAAFGSGVIDTTWAYTLPASLDGLYEINIRPADIFTNSAPRDQWPVWMGEIDNRGPETSLTIVEDEEFIDAGLVNLFKVETTYTCWARDFNLVGESPTDASLDFQCPCDTLAPASTTITDTFYHEVSPWYAEMFTDTVRLYERTATCTVLGPTLNSYMRACDSYGHCIVPTPDIDSFSDQIPSIAYGVVLTPTHKTILTSTSSTSVDVRAYARDRIKTISVYDGSNPVPVGTVNVDISCFGNITTTQRTITWNSPTQGMHFLRARVTPCTGSSIDGLPNEIIVDTAQPPVVSILPTSLNRQHRLSYGRVLLKGVTSDTPVVGSGIARVEVNVEGTGWGEATLDGSNWRYEWNLGEEPDNKDYEVSVRATDRAGWTRQITQTVTVDLDVPNPVTLTLTSTVTGESAQVGSILRVIPDALNFSWEASEPSDKLLWYQVDWTIQTATQTLQIPQLVSPTWPLNSTYPVFFDAQKISPSVTSVFTDLNSQVDDWGPVYIDTPLTPDYIQIPHNPDYLWRRSAETPYHGWMDSGCSLLGIDRRIQESAQSGAALNDPQNFYVTWDSEALRLAWTGANWNYDGDLFIYLDTLGDPSVPLTVTNPFQSPQDVDINIPGAKAFIWVQDAYYASLYYWNGTSFDTIGLNASQYRFEAGLQGGLTDLYIPFDLIGIDNPVTTPLVLFAFAADEGELALWATMPATNLVNSAKVIDKTDLYAGANQLLQWLHVYAWPSLAPGLCPNYSLAPLPLFSDADLRFNLSASPEGNTYGLMSDDLFWLGEDLTELTRTVDLSQFFAFMDVDHPPVGDGETLSYTINYENHGTYTATNVVAQAFGMYALELTPGVSNTISNTMGQVNQAISITIGTIPPGATGSVTFNGYVNTTGPYNDCMTQFGDELICQPYRDYAMLGVAIYDTATFIYGMPLEWLWADHVVDYESPKFFGILRPEYIIGEGTNLFGGYAFDASGVVSLTLEADPPLGSSYPTQCPDDTPADGFWSCSWDAGSGSDGDIYQIRLQATDGYGQTGEWTPWRNYLLDTIAPTLTLSAATAALTDTIIDKNSVTFSGLVEDNHGLGGVEVCFDGACGLAGVEGEGSAPISASDEPASAVAIGVCGGGAISRTFVVTDSFALSNVSLGLNIDHPQRDELSIILEKGAISVTLMAPPTGTPGNYANLDVFLNDANPIELHAKTDDNTALPFFERLARPDNPLSAFQGADSAGTWTLTICDSDAMENMGNYNQALLMLQPQNSAPTAAEWTYTVHNLDEQDYVSHTVEITAFDLVDLHSETVSLTLWVDNVNPSLNQGSGSLMPSLPGSNAPAAINAAELPLVGIGALPELARVLEGSAADGGAIQQFYAMVLTPSGERLSVQVGRSDNDWWFDLLAAEPGEYTIWINAVDEAGNADTLGPYTVTVVRVLAENDGPTALGSATALTATVLGDSGTYTYAWDFGDGSVASDQLAVVSHPYPSVGAYTATVTATTGTQAFTATTQVVVDEIITGLAADNGSPTFYGDTTPLTATISAGSNVSYSWRYGDGQPSVLDTQAESYHRYPAGFFTATVTATNSVSVMTATTQVSVAGVTLVNDSPTALGNATTFTVTLSGGEVYTYSWDLGNGTDVISNQLSVISATYAAAGFYTATVTADSDAGLITATTPVTISGLTVSNDSPTVLGSTTTFTATAIAMSGPITYTWDFGDETEVISNQLSVISNTYVVTGAYTAVVTATNGILTITQDSSVIVDEAITGLSAVNDSPTLLGNETTLTATITAGSNVVYGWDFGDESGVVSGTLAVVTHTYAVYGSYNVVVTATNSVSVLTTTTTVTAEEAISGLALINDSPTILDNETTLTATLTTGSHVTYWWQFGDGSDVISGTTTTVAHTYPGIGTFTAVVTATNSFGSLSVSSVVTITNEPIAGLAVVNDSPTALGQVTTMTATVTAGGGISYDWDFGDEVGFLSGKSSVVTYTYLVTGVFSAVVTATNSFNGMTATTVITIDGTAPLSAISDPLDGQVISGTVYTIRGNAGDDVGLARVEVSTDGGASWHTATGTTNWTYNWSLPIENGIDHNLRSRAVDLVGNVEVPGAGITVTVDNLAPGVQIMVPANGSTLTGTQAIISGIGGDPAVYSPAGLGKIEVSTDGGQNWHQASGTETWVYTWNLPLDENGVVHNLLARATDYVGHRSFSAPITVTVDTVTPSVVAVQPIDGAVDVALDADLRISFSEQVKADSLDWQAIPDPGGWVFAWDSAGGSVTATHPDFQNGITYEITLNVIDLAGNQMSKPFTWTFSTREGIIHIYLPILMR
jgi:PKD repeat protein